MLWALVSIEAEPTLSYSNSVTGVIVRLELLTKEGCRLTLLLRGRRFGGETRSGVPTRRRPRGRF